MLTKNYKFVISKFPQTFSYVFAYGSGVKTQIGYENLKKPAMIDFIFSVKDSRQWHSENLILNQSHYSGMKYFGSDYLAQYQDKFGAKTYCNTLIPLKENLMFKYSVITESNLKKDLLEWSDLYLAGRLHKPVDAVIEPDKDTKLCLEKNLKSAVHTALIMLPPKFSRFDLFYTISNLSYAGDFRMIFGENKNKVRNIVEPQMDSFFELYKSTLIELQDLQHLSLTPNGFQQNNSLISRKFHFSHLPSFPTKLLKNYYIRKNVNPTMESISKDPASSAILINCLKSIVFKSSATQSFKNIPTAGIMKSLKYSWQKTLKTFNL